MKPAKARNKDDEILEKFQAMLQQSLAKVEEKIDLAQKSHNVAIQESPLKIARKIKPLEWLGIALSVIAIIFAIHAEYTLSNIDSAVATRYVGSWPDHFSEVTGLIKRAEKPTDKIWILGDFVGAWHYTRPSQYFEDYFKKLRDGPMQVEMLVFDKETALDRLQQQFKSDYFCSKTGEFIGPKHMIKCTEVGYYEDTPDPGKGHFSKYTDYLDYYRGTGYIDAKTPNPVNYGQFLTLLLGVQDRFCKELSDDHHRPRIQIRTLDNPKGESLLSNYAYYYWILNNDEMVLSFRRYNDVNTGSAFKTKNADFLREFVEQMDGRWKESTGEITKAGETRKPGEVKRATEVQGYCYSKPVNISTDENAKIIHD